MPRVYFTEDPDLASLTIQIVKTKFLADVLIHRPNGPSFGSNSETSWTIVADRDQANYSVFVHDGGHHRPDLRVAFVNNPTEAGWMRRAHPLRGKLRDMRPTKVMH